MTISSLTKKWRDAFIMELRLRGATGAQIGDELALVESHCLDAGTQAQEAFGDPVDYARSVVVSATGGLRQVAASYGRALVARTIAQTVGLMTVLNVVPAVRKGGEVSFTLVDVVLVLILATFVVVLVAKSEAVMRYVVTGSILVVGLSAAVLVGLLVLVGFIPAIFSVAVPTGPAAAAGIALLVVPSLFGWPPAVDDAIVEPLAQEQGHGTTTRSPSAALLRWFVPAAGLVMCAVRWWVP